jgi:hypothetical protein
MRSRAYCLLVLGVIGCSEETGSSIVEFDAFAGGRLQNRAKKTYTFDSGAGYQVTLTRADLTIGAVYLNRARPVLGGQDTACYLPGLYAAEVRSSVAFDALSEELVPFEGTGIGTADRALTGEVWYTGGEIDALKDGTRILSFEGTATKGASSFGFYGAITISQNRAVPSTDPATPGANPLCKERIVTPISVDIKPRDGGRLELRVLPEVWFDQVDFAGLEGALGHGEVIEIPDSREDSTSSTLFQGLRSNEAYQLEWKD